MAKKKQKADPYAAKWVEAIKAIDRPSISPEEYDEKLKAIIDKIYSDGFEDGTNEGSDPDSVREGMADAKEFERESMD